MLVEEGKVRLTDPVSTFIPELQGLSAVVQMSGGMSASRNNEVTPKAGETVAQIMPRLKNHVVSGFSRTINVVEDRSAL